MSDYATPEEWDKTIKIAVGGIVIFSIIIFLVLLNGSHMEQIWTQRNIERLANLPSGGKIEMVGVLDLTRWTELHPGIEIISVTRMNNTYVVITYKEH